MHASQVPAGILLPDYAEKASPTSELESRQQRTGKTLVVYPYRALPSQLCLLGLDVHAAAVQTCCGRTVPIRSAREIEGLRAACRLAREVLDKAHAVVRPGVTTDEIDRVVRRLFRHLH